MRSRIPVLCSTLTCLALGACGGDSRRDLVGDYDVTGSLTFVNGNGDKDTQTVNVPLTIIADAFDSERIYLDFDCGLPAAMNEDDPGFQFTQKSCDAYDIDDCTFVWTYNIGGGSKEEGSQLTLNPGGFIKGVCTDGSSGRISFLFKLTGTPKGAPSSNPGEQDTRSALRTVFHRAFERAIR